MCGVAGFCDPGRIIDQTEWPQLLASMGNTLVHRGPDGAGSWISHEIGAGLVHRRLAILDLSERASQPMVSQDRRFIISFNGEIYNHEEIRRSLNGVVWQTRSDTESLVECFARCGVEETLKRIQGMFAIALVDQRERKLHLIRDRIGEKPLTYCLVRGQAGRTALVFASQVNTLATHPSFESSLSQRAVQSFALHGYVSGADTIYENSFKVRPGECLTFKVTPSGCQSPVRYAYWSPHAFLTSGDQHLVRRDESIHEQLRPLLRQAVQSQMISDVPLGAFLSGGIDSSIVTSELRNLTEGPLHTFSVGFADLRYDESSQARAVATFLGTTHHEIQFRESDALEVVQSLSAIYDEPFADSSQIPTVALAKYAREYVTVALSGDGGDELFGGYERYRLVQRFWSMLKWLPPIVRQSLGGMKHGSFSYWLDSLQKCETVPGALRRGLQWYQRAAPYLSCHSRETLYRQIITSTKCEALLETSLLGQEQDESKHSEDFLKQMMATDLHEYLPSDILVKVDRAAMATGLETRIPLLDKNLVQWSLGLPSQVLRAKEGGKMPLRNALAERLPAELMKHPKKGFGVPLDSWLRGPLRDWAESKLSVDSLVRSEAFSPERVRRVWQEHLSGQSNRQTEIWRVLMYQQWHEKNGGVNRWNEAVAA